MIPQILITATLSSLGGAPSATAEPDAIVTRIAAAPAREGWFVCDAIAGPYAVFAGKPDVAGKSVITILDRRTGRFDTQAYQVGRADPGAGQINWSLSRVGQAAGSVHGVNPGMVEGRDIPPIIGVAIDGKQLECRWLAHMRFIGLDSRRSVVVTEEPRGLVYQSYDFRRRGAVIRPDGVQRSNAATLKLGDGSEIATGFHFANGRYAYQIERPQGAATTAMVQVTRAGRPIGIDVLVGSSYATSTTAPPLLVTLGPDAVWSGKELDACRAKTAAGIDSCLVMTMRRTGASSSSIAFTQKLIARNDAGYISGWKQAGPIGIATVTYPFRANTNVGTVLIPTAGDPITVDAYQLTMADKARADYSAAQAQHPEAFPVPPGDVTIGKAPGGGLRVLVTTPTADCRACASNGSVVIGYDFDEAGHFLGAALVLAA